VRIEEASLARKNFYAERLHMRRRVGVLVDAIAGLPDVLHELREIEVWFPGGKAEAIRCPDLMRGAGGPEKGLTRHTAEPGAVASQFPALDQRGFRTQQGRHPRRSKTGGAASDHDHVIFRSHCCSRAMTDQWRCQTIKPVDREVPICIFAKPPVPSEVKTRLIPTLGALGAARLASAMLQDVWRTIESYPGVRPILATTRTGIFPVSVREGDTWLQGEGDLGQRVERILMRALERSAAVIAIGADSPAFSASHLRGALDGLENHDAVLGPATDGGFYLVGIRRCTRGLFAGLPWSTGETCHAVRTRFREHAFSIAELEPLFDVDTPADLSTLAGYLAAHSGEHSAVRAWWMERSCESA